METIPTMEEFVSDEMDQSCPTCGLLFHLPEDYQKHLKSHGKKEDFVCSVCGRLLRTKSALILHIKTHTRQDHPCKMCSMVFRKASTLRKHTKSHKQQEFRIFKCPHCAQYFDTKPILKLHLKDRHADEKSKSSDCSVTEENRTLECDKCKKTFKNKSKLQAHIMQHGSRVMVKCVQCEESFSSKNQRDKHGLEVHGQLLCIFCQKPCTSINGYRQHLISHDAKKYLCRQCGAGFHRKQYLNSHLTNVHKLGAPQILNCPKCDKSFAYQRDLNLHMRTHNQKIYSCSKCDKTFMEEETLQKHEKCHLTEWFVCDCCKNVFKMIQVDHGTVLLWTEKMNRNCLICSHEEGRRTILQRVMKTRVELIQENKAYTENTPPLVVNGEIVQCTAESHTSYYRVVEEQLPQLVTLQGANVILASENAIVGGNVAPCNNTMIAQVVTQQSLNNGNTNAMPIIISASSIDLSAFEEINQAQEILNSLGLDLTREVYGEIHNINDIKDWLKTAIKSKEAFVKKQFLKFAQVINETFPDYDEHLVAARNYFCSLDSSKQIPMIRLIKNLWKFKCVRVKNVGDSRHSLKIAPNEGNSDDDLVLETYPNYMRFIIPLFNNFLGTLSQQPDIISQVINVQRTKKNFIEIIVRANEKKDLMVIFVVQSSSPLVLDLLRAWLQDVTQTIWNVKSMYYKSVCPVQNYSKMILLYGMNCIEAKVGKIILPLFPRMLFDNSINEADLLGDALLDHMSCTKASLLLHIGCGYGITTLKLSRSFDHLIGIDQAVFIKQAKKIQMVNHAGNVVYLKDEIKNVETIFEKLDANEKNMAAILNIDSSPGKSKIILDKLIELPTLTHVVIVTSWIESSLPTILKLLQPTEDPLNHSFVPVTSCVVDPEPVDDNMTVIILLKRKNIGDDVVTVKTECIDVESEMKLMEFSDNERCVSSESSEDDNEDEKKPLDALL